MVFQEILRSGIEHAGRVQQGRQVEEKQQYMYSRHHRHGAPGAERLAVVSGEPLERRVGARPLHEEEARARDRAAPTHSRRSRRTPR